MKLKFVKKIELEEAGKGLYYIVELVHEAGQVIMSDRDRDYSSQFKKNYVAHPMPYETAKRIAKRYAELNKATFIDSIAWQSMVQFDADQQKQVAL